MNQAACYPLDKERVVNLELDSVLELLVALLEHTVQTLGLGDGAGEAVENETIRTTC